MPSIEGVQPVWSPDSTLIAVTQLNGNVTILERATGKVVLTYQRQNSGSYRYGLGWSPDGKRIASAGDQSIQIWNAATGQKLFTYTGQTGNAQENPSFGSLTWSPDGRYIASISTHARYGGGGTIEVWRAV